MILAVVISAAVAAIGCVFLIRYSDRLGLMDEPNERSLHVKSVPRSGGIGLLLGIVAGLALLLQQGVGFPAWLGGALAAAVLVALVSLLDDYRSVSAGVRLAAHLGASLTPVFCGLSFSSIPFPGFDVPLPGLLGPLFTVLFTAWLINLYNFMDGMDGFAGSMTLIGFASLAGLAALAGQVGYAALAAVVAAAAFGFLLHNRPPARIFLGDVGSATLGYLVAVFILWGQRYAVVDAWLAVMIFSVFIFDASVTLIRRALRREPLWRAHRTHHYQRLVRSGWSHARTTGAAAVLMLGCSAAAFWARGVSPPLAWGVVGFWLVVYAAVFRFVTQRDNASRPQGESAT